ncbi:MAG: EVE domain-containing protein [Dehalococcoidia bacterium]|uniref:EVE domain-containing protein n=1 Tax=Candidatus Amarobacter glycogenicus TaxID=3140699 RepID=UPI003137598D|nr:EVE domain-containing protein [Dehalococcoidia bacterium]
MARNWVVVGGPEIFAKTRELGFTRHGFKSTRRNMANSIQPGDLLAFYVTGRKQFAAIARVTTPVVEEHTRIWQSDKKPNEMYPTAPASRRSSSSMTTSGWTPSPTTTASSGPRSGRAPTGRLPTRATFMKSHRKTWTFSWLT